MKNITLSGIALAISFSMASSANAQIAGHNVILVHGFQSDDINGKPSDAQVRLNGEAVWAQTEFWLENSEARLDWGSDGRVEGKIASQMYDQAVEISQAGLCDNGCVMVTISTGDLTTRYFLAHQEDWLSAAGLEPLNIITVLDFAGAGGGTEVADVAVGVANGDINPINNLAVAVFLDGIPAPEDLGVLIDLQPVNARNLGTEPMQIPHLRYTGTAVSALNVYILGDDDGVVPAHSTCGSVMAEAIDSCSSSVAFDGEQTSVKGPTALLSYHYPVLMGDGTGHVDTITNVTGNKMTYVNNNFTSGLNTSLSTYTADETPWWLRWSRNKEIHQYVTDSENQTMSQVVFNSLSN